MLKALLRKGIAIQSMGYRLTTSLSALNLGYSSLPMGVVIEEAAQESSHGVNLYEYKRFECEVMHTSHHHLVDNHPYGLDMDVCPGTLMCHDKHVTFMAVQA